jgi:hypothetical protein
MKDSTIERAMSEEFERIDSMMFIRIKRSQLRPENNIVTYVEDNDC